VGRRLNGEEQACAVFDSLFETFAPMVAFALFAALVRAVPMLFAKARPAMSVPDGGRIRPSRAMIAVGMVFGLCLIVYGVHGWWVRFGDGSIYFAAVGLLFFSIFASGLASVYDVCWDRDSIEGPASYGMWPFGPRRARIDFAEITDVGVDGFGSFYVAEAPGNYVRWNWTYAGFPAVMMAVAEACPHLVEAEEPVE
jgi:hypothetical protein